MFKEDEVRRLFEKESILITDRDVEPEYVVERLFGKEACAFAKRMDDGKHHNAYGIGDFTIQYLTFRGVQLAATFCNVKSISLMEEGAVNG